jgi:hypothetical protein
VLHIVSTIDSHTSLSRSRHARILARIQACQSQQPPRLRPPDFLQHGATPCQPPGLSRRQMDRYVRPSVTSDKVLIRQIRVNAMLTSDKVKPELLCLWWLLHRCHVGWLDVLPLYCTGCRAHSSMEGANGCHRGAYGRRVGRARMK